MSQVIVEIQKVRALRKDVRAPMLSSTSLSAIEKVQGCLHNGTDLQGWKKVEWRGSGNGNGSGSGNGYGGAGRQPQQTNGAHRTPFGNRPSNGSSSSYGMNRTGNTSAPRNYFNSSTHSRTEPNSIPLTAPSNESSAPQQQHSAPAKYVSRFKKANEETDDTILNTIILGKLNKFSVANYDEIKEFITHIIDNGQTELIKCFMKLVFQKAASEETFCPLYAKLISELSKSYPVLLSEMTNLYKEYSAIFEEVRDASVNNYSEFLETNVEKKYRRGYSQFLAELIKHDVIDKDLFLKTITTIVKQSTLLVTNSDSSKQIEEYADCLMKIVKALQSEDNDDNDDIVEIIGYIKDNLFDSLRALSTKNPDNKGLTNKARFAFLDILESIEKL